MSYNLKRRKTVKHDVADREVSASKFIPYFCHFDEETILTKNKEFIQFIKVEGFAFETADDEDIDIKKAVRNSMLKSLGSGNIALWFHTLRRRQKAFPGGQFKDGYAKYINDKWLDKQSQNESYINELYISVCYKHDTAGAAKFEHIFNQLLQTTNKESRESAMKEQHKELKETAYRITAALKDYNARILTCIKTDHGVYSEPLEFLSKVVNAGEGQPMLVPTMDISHYLPTVRLYFGRKAIEIRTPTRKRFAALLSIKEYAQATAAGMMDAFLQLPFELIVSQSFTYINRQVAIEKMQLQQRRMMQSEDVAVSQVAEISDALDMAMSGHVAFGEHHLTILCIEDSLRGLEDATSMAIAELTNLGINAVRESFILESCYWAQLPTNYSFVARNSTINSMNVAAFASLHNYPVGRIARNHWGHAVTVFGTTSGTPYFFNFHARDVGHTTIIGPTGAGKTVLMNFLCAQALKFNCRMFFFDKDRGAEIFIRALGGNYTILRPTEKCHFNPMQLPDTSENRSFMSEWFQSLMTIHGESFSAEDMSFVNEAIRGNYKLHQRDRSLRNVAPFFGLEGPGTPAGRLRMWHSQGQYSGMFDNDEDQLDFSRNNIFGFEMGEILADKVSLAPTLLYLFHRIQLSLDGTPTIIVLDEAWALIDNEIFAQKIKDWLKTMRKLNAMVIFATQSVEDASKSAISDTLIQQTATQIFLPNSKATQAYRDIFMLSEREFNLLKNTDPATRFFLLKQGSDVVVARIDLSGMMDVINILSGRAETVSLMEAAREEAGVDPKDWIPVFQQKVNKMQEDIN